MHTISATCEICESPDEKDFRDGIGGAPTYGSKFSTEDDINRLFESITSRNMGFFLERKDSSTRNPLKRPMTVSRIGKTEPVSLKQALRGMCISQASEMAATKRFSKPGNNLASSDAFTTRQLYGAVVIKANQSGLPLDICEGSAVEVSDSAVEVNSTQKISRVEDLLNEHLNPSDRVALPKEMTRRNPSPCDAVTHVRMDLPSEKLDSAAKEEAPRELTQMELSRASSTVSNLTSVNRGNRTVFNASYFLGPIRRKGFVKKKLRQESSASNSSSPCSPNPRFDSDGYGGFNECRSNHISEDAWTDGVRANVDNLDPGKHCRTSSTCGVGTGFLVRKADREKGEFSQSSKSSVGDFSCSTSSSEMSNLSRLWRSRTRPHMSKDSRWEAIRSVQTPNGGMNLRNLKLLKRLGSGDIGTVYLAELTGTNCLFALKVMDLEFLGARRKLTRAETEKSVMQMLDHPFLPTLYAHISTEKLSCLVMEYCPGGDLHVLRQKQPTRSFSEQAARFYVAEVLLALEYLHMLGVIYRDLKPENVLVREDGHIMLSDFDLSLRCSVTPTVITSSPESEQTTRMSTPCNDSSCMEPFCLNPSFHLPCFTPRFLSIPTRSQKSKPDLSSQIIPMQQIVVEPTNARSNSFVGTHEYLAPEIIKGEGHGSAVDWWTFGIFLYELLFGKTPFKGSSNEETLANVVSGRLMFPDNRVVSHQAKDLIRELLSKNPDNRLGSVKGAAEIKWHAFFKGLNWALIRCAVPPELPKGPLDMSEVGDGSLEAEMQMGFEVF